MGANFWSGGDYDREVSKYNKLNKANTNENITNLGRTGANAIGQNAGVQATQAASNAGMTKGQAAAVGENVANEAMLNNEAAEADKVAQQKADEIAAQEKAVQEEAEQAKTNKSGALGTLASTATGAATGALTGAAAGGVGAIPGALVGAGTGLASGLASWLSDERCKYKSKIIDKRLLGK